MRVIADQLIVPLAILASGRRATRPLTAHSRTNFAIVAAFGGQSSLNKDAGIIEISADPPPLTPCAYGHRSTANQAANSVYIMSDLFRNLFLKRLTEDTQSFRLPP